MIESTLISASENSAWMKALNSCGNYDIYHLPQYHLLAEKMGEGTPFLFFFQEAGYYAALPFLCRQISEVQGLEDSSFFDATSVYGYPGIVSNIKNNGLSAEKFRNNFQKKLLKVLLDKNVIAFFSRQNPLLQTSWLLDGLADIQAMGDTVAVDLTQSIHDQEKSMSKNHRRDIKKAKKLDVFVYEDKEFKKLNEFVFMYNETMKRNNAADYYFFSKDYYDLLKRSLGDKLKLFVAEKDGEIVSAALFFITGQIIQYHLSGTPDKYLSYSGLKTILYEVQRWGNLQGYKWLHLGGGLGSTEDSLLRFKAGFSKSKFSFEIIKSIVKPEIYKQMVAQKNCWIQSHGYDKKSDSYFPDYRAPL